MSTPSNPPLEVGLPDEKGNGVREAWSGLGYLQVCCRVRNSLVRLYELNSMKGPNESHPDIWIPTFGEDCGGDEADGFFVHPGYPNAIRIPSGGSGRFWIEFEHGKWLFPRTETGDFKLLNRDVTDFATRIFGTGIR